SNGRNWLVTVPQLVAGDLTTFTVRTQLSAPTGTAVVTTTAEATTSNFGPVAYPHRIDALPPVLTVDPPTEAILGVGAVQVLGQARDEGGGYVAEVEYRLNGGAWQTASGTNSWRINTTTSSGQTQLIVDVRASDQHGNTSAAERITYAVDGIAPDLTLELPEAITDTIAIFGGTAVDSFPDFSRVVAAEVRLDEGDWESAFVYDPDQLGDPQQWSYTWNLPAEDNVQHTVRVRGYDVVLNRSAPVVQSVIVDNVAPTYTVGTVITQVVVADYQVELGDPVPPAVLAGQVTDGSGVRDIQVLVTTPDGRAYFDPVFRTGDGWEYVPALDNTAVGNYRLTVFFTDEYGNVREYNAPTLLATDEPITGLAIDEAPFIYATAGVPYTATVSTGTNISYTWDFGDGRAPINPPVDALGEGMRLTYAYQQMGTYTLTLSASNSANAVTVTKQISVTEMPIGIPLVETSFEDNPFTDGW
ncbi:MAG: PKD domain-containing protein, partial [Anaerolineales bacterium]|nr:PKD domain-containing protein [Anaerolineales bacterium]